MGTVRGTSVDGGGSGSTEERARRVVWVKVRGTGARRRASSSSSSSFVIIRNHSSSSIHSSSRQTCLKCAPSERLIDRVNERTNERAVWETTDVAGGDRR